MAMPMSRFSLAKFINLKSLHETAGRYARKSLIA